MEPRDRDQAFRLMQGCKPYDILASDPIRDRPSLATIAQSTVFDGNEISVSDQLITRMTSTKLPDASQLPLQLAPGRSSTLRGITENFSFHSSPESFIAARIAQWQKSDPTALDKRMPIRARILNRNVVVVSSYHQIQSILGFHRSDDSNDPPFIAADAYHELMNLFFPPPNLLLADGCPHKEMRPRWEHRMQAFHQIALDDNSPVSNVIRQFIVDKLDGSSTKRVDLYEEMKTLAWQLLLQAFLGLSDRNEDGDRQIFEEFQKLHETLLRGQFSLVPLSINAWLWQSPRSKGIRARKKLQELITQRMHDLRGHETDIGKECVLGNTMIEAAMRSDEIRDHILMMTSSLAVKGLASFLTALLTNLFMFEMDGVKLVNHRTMAFENGAVGLRKRLRSICLETERLSPPIVGVMRRATRDMVLEGDDGEANTLLPRDWDIWLYFVGGGRDPAVYGETCMTFDPGRFLEDSVPEPLGFGTGPKSCLGKNFLRDVALRVAEQFLMAGTSIVGELSKPGIRGWLGWDAATPEQWASDMKQLPTQHPARPMMVRFVQR